jgi:hypothetical protein
MMGLMLPGKPWLTRLNRIFAIDARRQVRIRTGFRATLSGPFGTIDVAGTDVTRDGAGSLSSRALPVGALVFVRILELNVMAFAHVRHCAPTPGGFLLGLRFREPLVREHDIAAQVAV